MLHHIKILSAIFLCCLCSYGFNLYHLSDLHFSDWNDTNSLNIVKAVNNDTKADVVVVSLLIVHDLSLLLLPLGLVEQGDLYFLVKFHLLTHLLLGLLLHVASALVDDVSRLLPRLLNLFKSTILFGFQ